MRYLLLLSIFALSAELFAFDDNAEDSDQYYKKNTIGTALGVSLAIDNLSRDDSNLVDAEAIFYEYHFDKRSSVDIRLQIGSGGNSPDGDFSLFGGQVSYKAQYNFSDKFDLYGRVGANLYSTTVKSGGNKNDSSGIGFVGGTGIEYTTNDGFVTGFNVEYITAGDLDTVGVSITLAYSF